MPSLRNVGWVVQDYEPLDLATSQERDGCNSSLPSENAEPACIESVHDLEL
jgi:hypothetical protein